jgi:hypothetical protein
MGSLLGLGGCFGRLRRGAWVPPLAIVYLEHNLALTRWALTKGADRNLKGGCGRLP